jgi:hypothetical protein
MMTSYLKYYDLERYLFGEVGPNFRRSGRLDYVDLFLILHWKSMRAKTRVKNKLAEQADGDFKKAVEEMGKALYEQKDLKERLRILMDKWKLRLPMASAILTVLYPDDFTVYDWRVCEIVDCDYKDYSGFSDECWKEYESFKRTVCEKAPSNLDLRDKDRFLWAKSFYKDAKLDADK